MNAFRSWPLNPVVQGLTVTTLLLLKQMKTVHDTKTRKENPPSVDNIMTECCFRCELFGFRWFEDGEGEAAEIQLEICGVDISVGGFDVSGKCEVVSSTADEGDGEGEGESSGDVIGDGEFEGVSDMESSEDDGEICLESGDDDGEGVFL